MLDLLVRCSRPRSLDVALTVLQYVGTARFEAYAPTPAGLESVSASLCRHLTRKTQGRGQLEVMSE